MDFTTGERKVEFIISDKKKKEIFISTFHLIKNASSQINLIINKVTFRIQGMDKSHICLFDLNLNNLWFDYYEVNKEYKLSFDTNIFYSIISTKSEDQALIFYLEDENSESLTIELKNGVKKNDYNKFFTLPLLDYEYGWMIIPDTEYDADLSLPSKKVTDMFSQLSNFGDDINIICSQNCVDFKTKGTSGEMRVNIPVDDMSSYAVIENEKIDLVYSLVYISRMCITNKLTTDIEFNLSKEYPMKINYNLGHESSLMYHIAPKLADA